MKRADNTICSGRRAGQLGFTLMELLLALTILSVITTAAYMTFSTVTMAWKRSMTMSENLHHGDFVMEQIVMAIRSAYYPDNGVDGDYGFWLDDDGEGAGSWDKISFVKIGPSLVGRGERFGEGPHRVEVYGNNDDDVTGIRVKAWGLLDQIEDFDPDELEPRILSTYVQGFNCRVRDPEMEEDAEEIEWIDEWEDTNRVPLSVELTVYVEPVEEGREALEVKRIIELPLAILSWQGASPGSGGNSGGSPDNNSGDGASGAGGETPSGAPPDAPGGASPSSSGSRDRQEGRASNNDSPRDNQNAHSGNGGGFSAPAPPPPPGPGKP